MAVKKQITPRSSQTKSKSPVKKTVLKKVAKKVPAKKSTPLKKPLKKATNTPKKTSKKNPRIAQEPTKQVSKLVPKEVVLPQNMSIRSREKVLVLKHEWRKAMHSIAYVSGLCFAVVGSTLALMSVFGATQFTGQPALIADTSLALSINAPQPVLTLESTIPKEVKEDLQVSFSLNDVSVVKAKLSKTSQTSSFPDLEINNLLNNKYRVNIKQSSYPAGWYDLQIVYISNYGVGSKIIGTFYIGTIPEGGAVIERPDVDPAVVAPVTDPATVANPFRIFTEQSVLNGTVKIGLAAPTDYTVIELYARPLNSLNSQFLTLATERFGQRQFAFDTTSRLANGQYELYAQTKSATGQTVRTKSVIVSVSNTVSGGVTEATPTIPDTPESTSPIKLPPNFEIRDFLEIEFVREETSDSATEKETLDILNRNATEIQQLIRGYAVAKQSGDEMLIAVAKKTLQEKRQSLVFEAMNDNRVKDLADNIDVSLEEKFAEIEKRVDAFEAIRNERSGGNVATDTDGDGITDFDEVNIYETNPNNADSDGDGFTDGVEIIRGYNPLDAKSEAIIRFESPRDTFGLVREDIFSIKEVIPVMTLGEESVRAQVIGKGLPNTFVTLYIFSNPIVVTVKTDADGSFMYTLDKELEDGTHDVFVALTDNTGAILGQSNMFSFVKQAQAFTPVDASEAAVVTNENIIEVTNQNAYSTVAGVGILALGIILIMLGVSLRTKKDEEEEGNELQSGRFVGDASVATDSTVQKGTQIEHIDAT